MREQARLIGRPLAKRTVGSTLLLKGLESDVAVILDPSTMDRKHLYVAMTRGAKQLKGLSSYSLISKKRIFLIYRRKNCEILFGVSSGAMPIFKVKPWNRSQRAKVSRMPLSEDSFARLLKSPDPFVFCRTEKKPSEKRRTSCVNSGFLSGLAKVGDRECVPHAGITALVSQLSAKAEGKWRASRYTKRCSTKYFGVEGRRYVGLYATASFDCSFRLRPPC